jgi:nucleoside-diphosphate-sugar epimerase
MHNLIVLGGTGYLGSNIVSELKSSYEKTVILSRTQRTKKTPQDTSLITLDLINQEWDEHLTDVFSNPFDMVIASWPSLHDYNDGIHFDFAHALKGFFERVIKFAPRKIYIAGTCFEYRKQSGELRVLDDLEGRNNYAKAKVLTFNFFREIFKQNPEYNTSILYQRIWYLYGRENSPRSLLATIKNLNCMGKEKNTIETLDLQSNGEQILDYVNIENVLYEIKRFFLHDEMNRCFIVSNACSGDPVRLKDFIDQYCREKNFEFIHLNWKNELVNNPTKFYGRKEKINIE